MGRYPGVDLAPGTIVAGRYRVLRLLGRGGMGAVYEAFEEAIERRLALKLLHPVIAQEPQVAARFLEEAKLANRVRHPAIVEVTDLGTHEGRPFLAMELLEGESLGDRLTREGPFEPAAAVTLLGPVFDALVHLHERGIVHRDLKPDNLFLARVGPATVPRILDLGIAKARSEGASLTATDAMLGTPAYMAPEQVRSSRSVTPLADQYAMGCVVYEMLTGRMPIEADNLHGVLVAKVTEDPVDILTWRPELPKELAAAVMRAVARDPAQRFADLAAFHRALVASLTAPFADTAPPPEPVAPAVSPEAPAAPAPAPPAAPIAAHPSRRALVAGVVAVTAAVVAVVALLRGSATDGAGSEGPPATTVRPPNAPTPRAAPAPSDSVVPAPRAPSPAPVEAPIVAPPTTPVAAAAVSASEVDAGAPTRHGHRHRPRSTGDGRLGIDGRNPLRGGGH